MRSLPRRRSAVAVVLLGILVSGCAGPTVTEPVSGTPSPSVSTTTPTADGLEEGAVPPVTCGAQSASDATVGAIAQIPPPFTDGTLSDVVWDAASADVDGFDSCAQLSWVVVSIPYGTVSSPAQVLLFHLGEFVEPAGERAYGFLPDVARADIRTISVTYTFPLDGEANAEASGRTVVTFTWDDAAQSVSSSGQFPPF